ncbi:MAG: flagellar protein FlgN [Erythrobacter sp.]|uniref:flagellar protein FlgN n=1 Tax=Erythrobacter sp. TaxID=1042 RepID=UPI0032967D91
MTTHTPRVAVPHEQTSGTDRQSLCGNLRQMIAVLQKERQALATLEADTLNAITRDKDELCGRLADFGAEFGGEVGVGIIDPEARALVETAKALNDVNRRVRNLLAANVSGRLDALGTDRSGRHAYTAHP